VPTEDATVWRKLREAGAILIGKTGLHEMAAGFSNLNPFYGPTRNPWDPNLTTGGSSGGSGAAVAGHKPTFGRVSTQGALYLSWSLDHLGPMTTTVEDAALIMNVVAGYDPQNPLSAPAPNEDYAAGLNQDVKDLNLAVPANFWDFEVPPTLGIGPGLDPDVAAAVRAAIEILKDLGASVEEVAIKGLDDLAASRMVIIERAFVEGMPPERRGVSEYYRLGQWGLEATSSEYLELLRRSHRTHELLETALEGYDAFVMPTTPIVAPTIEWVQAEAAGYMARAAGQTGEAVPPQPPGSLPFEGANMGVGRYTSPFNRSGQPALSIPCGFSPTGLPIGLMVVGHRFDERRVLRIGHSTSRRPIGTSEGRVCRTR
jgi:aspartyl-tRNA(Asn)/glutamyl-tRNA(Gln) amidotransferase subunit A